MSVQNATPLQKQFRQTEDSSLQGYFDGILPVEYWVECRQKYESNYEGNGYVDILSPAYFIGRQKEVLYGHKIFPYVTSKVPDIDTVHDLHYADWLLNNHP